MVKDAVIRVIIEALEEASIPLEGRRLHDGRKVVRITCSKEGCGFVARSESGMNAHMRKHGRMEEGKRDEST